MRRAMLTALLLASTVLTVDLRASPPPADRPTLFGLSKGLPLEAIRARYEPVLPPVKQPDAYLLRQPPSPDPRFPMIVVTATPEAGLCAVSGSFVGDGQVAVVRSILVLLDELSGKYGPPTRQTEGRVIWESVSENEAGVVDVEIQSLRVSDAITLISVVYFLDNYAVCRKRWEASPPLEEDPGRGKDALSSAP